MVWLQARGQQSGAREGSLCSGPPAPLSRTAAGWRNPGSEQDARGRPTGGSPPACLCVRGWRLCVGGGGYPRGLLRGSGGAGPGRALPGWLGRGAAQGAGQPRGSPGSSGWRRGRLLSGPCLLSSACLTWSGEALRPWSSVGRGLPCRPLPSALPGSCQPVLTAWGAGNRPQPFERIPGDRHESWWSTRMPHLSLCP